MWRASGKSLNIINLCNSMNNYFKFKQFTVYQEHSAMKVGTDGVLLGAWGAVGEGSILDIGCGSGVITLMCAQRTVNSDIDGVDIDDGAVIQSRINVEKSPWGGRVNIFNSDIDSFCPNKKYNYILSNPPYFIESQKAPNKARTAARHTDTLPHTTLAKRVSELLADDGIFSVILPYIESNMFIVEAVNYGLYCVKRMDVRGVATKGVKRVMLQFSKEKGALTSDELIIENSVRGSYTQKYIDLTKDFYLKF